MKRKEVIGIIGTMGSGKDTFASFFKCHGYVSYQIAGILKTTAYRLIRSESSALWGDSSERTDKIRKLLQNLGDVVREYDEQLLIKHMVKEVGWLRKGRPVVVTDVRMLEEARAIKEQLGGRIIKIERSTCCMYGKDHTTETEAELASYPYVDYVISNSGDLEDLYAMHGMVENDLSRG